LPKSTGHHGSLGKKHAAESPPRSFFSFCLQKEAAMHAAVMLVPLQWKPPGHKESVMAMVMMRNGAPPSFHPLKQTAREMFPRCFFLTAVH